jgi:hypothetical protein
MNSLATQYAMPHAHEFRNPHPDSSYGTSSVKRKTKLGPATVVRHKQGV